MRYTVRCNSHVYNVLKVKRQNMVNFIRNVCTVANNEVENPHIRDKWNHISCYVIPKKCVCVCVCSSHLHNKSDCCHSTLNVLPSILAHCWCMKRQTHFSFIFIFDIFVLYIHIQNISHWPLVQTILIFRETISLHCFNFFYFFCNHPASNYWY